MKNGVGAKMANVRYWDCIVVIGVLFSLNLAAILKTCVSFPLYSS
jgi:hypothetical protein